MSEKLDIYKEKLENSTEVQNFHLICSLIKQKFSDLTINLFIIFYFSLSFLAFSAFCFGLAYVENSENSGYFVNATIFCLSVICLGLNVTLIFLFSYCCANFCILSNKEVLEVLDKSKEYEINQIIINKYKEQGCIYQIQKDLVCKYIEEQKKIEIRKKVENKIKEQDENENEN